MHTIYLIVDTTRLTSEATKYEFTYPRMSLSTALLEKSDKTLLGFDGSYLQLQCLGVSVIWAQET